MIDSLIICELLDKFYKSSHWKEEKKFRNIFDFCKEFLIELICIYIIFYIIIDLLCIKIFYNSFFILIKYNHIQNKNFWVIEIYINLYVCDMYINFII